MEIWKDIPGYEGLYEASSLGRIRTKEGKTTWSSRFRCNRVWEQRILKPKTCANKRGRRDARVELYKNKQHKTYLVARLVASTFLPGASENLTVNHIDGNPLNNKIDNLEWISLADNIRHCFANGLNSCAKKTTLISEINGKELSFISECEASRYLGRCNQYVSNCIKYGRKAKAANGERYTIIREELRAN